MRKSIFTMFICITLLVLFNTNISYCLTVNNYNIYCEDGVLQRMQIKFNDVVAKFNKYGHFKLGDDYMPSASNELSNEEDRDFAYDAIEKDTTYKIHGELDDEDINYNYVDYEDLSASEYKWYELKAKIDALRISNEKQEKSGYGKYNLRNGKNLIAFIKFAYEFYRGCGEYRLGLKDEKQLDGTEYREICPMEKLETYANMNSTSAVPLDSDFDNYFKLCVNKWEYVGSKDISNSDKIFETLEDIYVGLVYLYPALKVLEKNGLDIENIDDDDRAAIFSMAYEVKGHMPISSTDVSDLQLTKKFSKIGAGDLIGALIEDDLGFSVAERVYRYMIEIKHKNNPEKLARWIAEYEALFQMNYEPLDPDDYDSFIKAYNIAFRKFGKDISKSTGLDYINFGYVETPELFESKISLDKAIANFARELKSHFKDSAFMRNADNANYVAKSYMMAQKICENADFIDITDIYASDIGLVEHSYGYGENSTEVMLSDTQVVSLEFPLDDGDYDTDYDGLIDREELGELEEVDISRIIEAYIKYNELEPEEANKLRANSKVKMYAYKSNPVLPDSDFDGRDDTRDKARALLNDYTFEMDTLNNNGIYFDFTMDYRYFFMDSSYYYYELSDMSLALSNMIGKNKQGSNKSFENRNKVERYRDNGIRQYMWYTGFEDIEERNTGEVPYAIGHRDVFLRRGKVNHKLRNLITIVIGEDEGKKGEISANLDGEYGIDGEYKDYHHVGFDIEANKIVEDIEAYINNQNGEKVYWITGFGSGGSIASLVGQKLTDKKGVENVYCYTFESYPTINANNLQTNNNTRFSRYTNIFNILNDDNPLTKILDGSVGWYRYGRNVTGSAASVLNKKGVKSILGSNYIGHNGYAEYKGNPSIARKILDGIVNGIKELIRNITSIFGFTNTEPDEPAYRAPFESPSINTDIKDERQGSEETHKRIHLYGYESVGITGPQVPAGKDGGSIEGEFGNKNVVVGNVNLANNPNNDTLIDDRDGYPFNNYIDMTIDYNNSSEDTVKIRDFMYSNYTLDIDDYKDINYVKFWYDENENKPHIIKEGNDSEIEKLYEYKAGDMSKYTKCTHGNYIGKKYIEQYRNNGGEVKEDERLSLGNGGTLTTINNRILAAFPSALFSEDFKNKNSNFYKSTGNMNKVINYNLPNENDSKNGGNYKGAKIAAQVEDMYKLIDVVIEDADKQQFVVPFIVIDPKDIHLLPNYSSQEKKGMFSNLTDNRYGQVMEQIIDTNPKTYNYFRFLEVITNNKVWFDEELSADALSKPEHYVYQNQSITYYDKDAKRKATYVSPIEPYIKVSSNTTNLDNIITNVICGKGISSQSPNCRIVSMRVYNEKCANADGTPISGTWDERQREIEYKPDFFIELSNNDNKKNVIVEYK